MERIIQICTSHEEPLYGLGISGKLYQWNRKQFKREHPDEEGNTHEYRYGWVLLEDELNK